MEPSKKDLKEKQEWEWMKSTGHIRYTFQWIFMWIGVSFFVDALYVLTSNLGWVNPPAQTSVVDVVACAAIGGLFSGEWRWSELKRKFEALKPGEDQP